MVGQTLLIAVLPFLWLSGANSGLVPKCKSEDTKCLKESTQVSIPVFAKGLPEYNIKTMDPMKFKKIDASSPNLKLILSDITITGLKDCIAKKVVFMDKSRTKLLVKILCDAQLESQYEMDGQLLIISIKGKGPLHATLNKIELTVDANLEETEKGGDKYWGIKDWKHSFALKDKSDIVFEHLFDGNEILAQAAREVISSAGNDIVMEVGPPVIKTIAIEVINNIMKFFHSTPIKELTLDQI